STGQRPSSSAGRGRQTSRSAAVSSPSRSARLRTIRPGLDPRGCPGSEDRWEPYGPEEREDDVRHRHGDPEEQALEQEEDREQEQEPPPVEKEDDLLPSRGKKQREQPRPVERGDRDQVEDCQEHVDGEQLPGERPAERARVAQV